jgi:hypothetical protein
MAANSNPSHIRAEDLDNNPATMTTNSLNTHRLDVLADVASRQDYLPVPEARHQDLIMLAEAAMEVLDKGAADNTNTNTNTNNATTNHVEDETEYEDCIVVRLMETTAISEPSSSMPRGQPKKKSKKGKRNN